MAPSGSIDMRHREHSEAVWILAAQSECISGNEFL